MRQRLKPAISDVANAAVTAVIIVGIVFVILKIAEPKIAFASWLSDMVSGKVGRLPLGSVPFVQAIAARLPDTIELVGLSFIAAVVIGWACAYIIVRFGLRVVETAAIAVASFPYFWLAFMIQTTYVIRHPKYFDMPGGLSLVPLPVCILGLYQLPATIRYFCRLFGHHEDTHPTWASALAGVIRLFSDRLPELITATIITEVMFAWPGAGNYFFSRFRMGDYTAVASSLLVAALLVVATRFLCDLLSRWLPPDGAVGDV